MALEIERKFLVASDDWRKNAGVGVEYRQGYLLLEKNGVVRIRIAGDRAIFGLKVGKTALTRLEYEYDIPLSDAEEILLNLCEYPVLTKKRFTFEHAGMIWEVDEHGGENKGLVVAEVELEREGQSFDVPPWLGDEVSLDPRYLSFNLYRRPYCRWPSSERMVLNL